MTKKELLSKKFQAEGKVFTVYAVSGPGVFAHEGEEMETNDKGEVIEPRYFDYETVEANLVTAGRPAVGTTKKVSLTLPDELWERVEERKEKWGANQSQALRKIIEGYFNGGNGHEIS